MSKRILLCGAPSSGKTTVIKKLISEGFTCKPEISRELIKEAQQKGIANPFLENPKAFDTLLLEKRISQFKLSPKEATEKIIFFDRGIVDNVAYMEYALHKIPKNFEKALLKYTYNAIFLFEPWQKIHITDNERYESFEIASKINDAFKKVLNTYKLAYKSVPLTTVDQRIAFILNEINSANES